MSDYPKELYYTKDHEWVRHIEEEEMCVVGITQYAQDKLGEVVHVELPKEGDDVRAGESFGSVESVKAVSDVYSPIGGKVDEINTVLLDSPEIINEEPYEDGWLIKIRVTDVSVLDDLMSAKEYANFVDSDHDSE